MTPGLRPYRTIRSFVRREGRLTRAQRAAIENFWPLFGVNDLNQLKQLPRLFRLPHPIVFDIGFGNGEALFRLAQEYPHINFVGVEVYRSGIGNLLRLLQNQPVENLRIVEQDVVTVLQDYLQPSSVDGFTLWFPDPWPKKRHHKRRLVNAAFIQQIADCLRVDGFLHMATDWPDYAQWMERVMESQSCFKVISTVEQHPLQIRRPQTKFECRGLREGNPPHDFIYWRVES